MTDAGGEADSLTARAALERVPASVRVVYGSRDDTVEWEPLVERARDLEQSVVEFAADHYFVGQHGTVAEAMVLFLAERLARRRLPDRFRRVAEENRRSLARPSTGRRVDTP